MTLAHFEDVTGFEYATYSKPDASPRSLRWGMFAGQVTYDEEAFAPLTGEEVREWEEGPLFPVANDR